MFNQNQRMDIGHGMTDHMAQYNIQVSHIANGRRIPVVVGSGATVGSILRDLGFEADGHDIKYNNLKADVNTPITKSGFIIITKMQKGNTCYN